MDERSSVSLLCLVKGEGELKAKGMEVEKDLSRKEKIAQAKALLGEGEWKELGEGRKMADNMLAGHACSQSPLFENMWDCAHANRNAIRNHEGGMSYVCSVLGEGVGLSGSSLYNKLTQGSHGDLISEALNAGDIAYNANPKIAPRELCDVIGAKLKALMAEAGLTIGKGRGSSSRSRSVDTDVPLQKLDINSLVHAPNPETDPEYKELLNKVSEAQEKSNNLLASGNKDPMAVGNAFIELSEAQEAVKEYARTHADYTELKARYHADEEHILKYDLDYSDCYTRIQSLQEKAKRLSEIRNDLVLEVEKIKEMLRSSEK